VHYFPVFWTYKGNPEMMQTIPILELAKEFSELGVNDVEVIALYALVIGLEAITVLAETTRFERMKADLEGLELVEKGADGDGKEKWGAMSQWVQEIDWGGAIVINFYIPLGFTTKP
jgi:hypothetical protein